MFRIFIVLQLFRCCSKYLIVYGVISDFASKMQLLVEMEKSAAIMQFYGAEFAVASIFCSFQIKYLCWFMFNVDIDDN